MLARRIILGLGVTAVAVVGCGPERRGALANAPVTPDTVAEHRGERLFYKHCSRCHPGGESGLGPALNDKPLPELAIETQIRKGLGAMPAFSEHHLKDDEVDAIADFVIEMRKALHTPTPQPRPDADRPQTSAGM